MILGTLGLDVGPAVAGLGVVGIAVGFGAQTLVRDYLNGALILVENQFSKGDVIRAGGVAGTVEDFTLRRTTLRDIDGIVHTVPNGEIKVASNLTRVWARINEDVTVAYGTDIDRAIGVVDSLGKEMAADPVWKRRILEAPRVERVEALGEYGVTIKILGSVRATEQWAARGEFRKRLLAALEANGIEIPRPQRVVLAQDPDGPGPRPPEALVGPTENDLAADTD
jgi:small conductance mechanosensitive channel